MKPQTPHISSGIGRFMRLLAVFIGRVSVLSVQTPLQTSIPDANTRTKNLHN